MARNDPQINLRIPDSLKTGIEEAARKNNRSTTAEIVARLQRSLEADDVLSGVDPLDTLSYQAMTSVILNKTLDHTTLNKGQEKMLSQLAAIGENIIARMQFNKGNGEYATSPIPSAIPDDQ